MSPTRLVRCLAVAAIATLSCAGGESAEVSRTLQGFGEALKVPVARAPRLAEAVVPDRTPDFTAWGGPVGFGRLDGSTGAVPVRTEGYFACDESHLYLAIRCLEPEMGALPAGKAGRDGNVWKADSLEFMVLPGIDPREAYFQFAVDPAGGLYDARANDKSWNSRAETFAYRDKDGWAVVVRLPLKGLGADEETLPLWRVNLHRLRPRRAGAGELDLAWSPTHSRSNHVPARFGLVYLEGLGRGFDAEAVDARIAELKREQIVFRQAFGENTAGFTEGSTATRKTPGGSERFLRVSGVRKTVLKRNFGSVRGLKMAFAYRTAPHQHGLVIQGAGTVVSGARPGLVEVVGRGVRTARETCRDADRQTTASALGHDWYLFKRPYGH